MRMGNNLVARVTWVTDDSVRIDCNPELAGQHLTLDVELVDLVKVLCPSALPISSR